jgi:hypothetical protein
MYFNALRISAATSSGRVICVRRLSASELKPKEAPPLKAEGGVSVCKSKSTPHP